MHPNMAKHLHSEECVEWIKEYEKCNKEVHIEFNLIVFLVFLIILKIYDSI